MKFSTNQAKPSKLRTIATNVMVFALFFTIGFWSYRLNVQPETSSARTVPTDVTALDLVLTNRDSQLSARVSIDADYQLIITSDNNYTEHRVNPQETKISFTSTEHPVLVTIIANE